MSSTASTCVGCNVGGVQLRILHCLHSVCASCAAANRTADTTKCTLCLFVTKSAFEMLPTNDYAYFEWGRQRGLESCRNCCRAAASSYCRQCNALLCSACDSSIHGNAIFASHTRDAVPTSASPRRLLLSSLKLACSHHSNGVKTLFCGTCKCSVCDDCAANQHRGHTMNPLQTACTKWLAQSSDCVPRFTNRVKLLERAEAEISKTLELLIERASGAADQVNRAFDRLAATVEERRRVMLSRVDDALARRKSKLETQLDMLSTAARSTRLSESLAASLKTHQHDYFVANAVDIASRVIDFAELQQSQPVESQPAADPALRVVVDECKLVEIANAIEGLGDVTAPAATSRNFTFDHIGDRQGLLYFLGTSRGTKLYENPLIAKQVRVTASSVGYGDLSSVVTDAPSEFCTQNSPFSWVSIELDDPFMVTGYVLHHDAADDQSHFIRNWELQGLVPDVSEQRWEVLTVHHNDKTISERQLSGFWPVPGATTWYRKLRIVCMGPNSQGNHYLMLSAVELYGRLQSV